jgi:hypothetical protein
MDAKTRIDMPDGWWAAPTGFAMSDQGNDGDEPVGSQAGSEHRRLRRQRTLKAAKVVLTDWTTIDCTIRDLNEGGARLVFGDAFTLPGTFRLLTVSTNTIAPVELRWQRGKEAGVAFAGPAEPARK